MMQNRFVYVTSIGKITIADNGNGKISYVGLPDKEFNMDSVEKESPVIKEAGKQLQEYLAGTRKTFDVPLEPKGTEFQITVWKELCKIPYGTTAT